MSKPRDDSEQLGPKGGSSSARPQTELEVTSQAQHCPKREWRDARGHFSVCLEEQHPPCDGVRPGQAAESRRQIRASERNSSGTHREDSCHINMNSWGSWNGLGEKGP